MLPPRTPAERAAVWGNEGMLLHAQRRLGEAQDAYQRAIGEHESARWRYLHGVALAESGALEESITDFRRAVVLAPNNMPAWYRLGTALLQAGDAAAAETALERAQVLAPESALVLAALADVSILLGEPGEALARLNAAFRLEPEAGQLAYKMASVHRRLGHVAEAQAWLGRDPGNRLAPTIDDPGAAGGGKPESHAPLLSNGGRLGIGSERCRSRHRGTAQCRLLGPKRRFPARTPRRLACRARTWRSLGRTWNGCWS